MSMKWNVENCFRNELPKRLQWLGDQMKDSK
jgi:hypothetical protein